MSDDTYIIVVICGNDIIYGIRQHGQPGHNSMIAEIDNW